MANDAKTAIGDLMTQTRGMLAVNPVIGSQCQSFWKAQESILQETEAFSRAWFERRHEATRTALEVARQVGDSGGSEPAEAMRAITDWQRGSVERLTQDMREWLDLSARCTAHLAGSRAEDGGGKDDGAGSERPATSRSRSR